MDFRCARRLQSTPRQFRYRYRFLNPNSSWPMKTQWRANAAFGSEQANLFT